MSLHRDTCDIQHSLQASPSSTVLVVLCDVVSSCPLCQECCVLPLLLLLLLLVSVLCGLLLLVSVMLFLLLPLVSGMLCASSSPPPPPCVSDVVSGAGGYSRERRERRGEPGAPPPALTRHCRHCQSPSTQGRSNIEQPQIYFRYIFQTSNTQITPQSDMS